MRDAQWEDEWGTRWAHAFGGVGATPIDCPLKDWSQLDEYLARRVPDPRTAGRSASTSSRPRAASTCGGSTLPRARGASVKCSTVAACGP